MRIFYATRDGHSRRIAEQIAARLGEQEIAATAEDLAAGPQLEPDAPVVVVMAVRYGKHLPEAEHFLKQIGRLAAPPSLQFCSR